VALDFGFYLTVLYRACPMFATPLRSSGVERIRT
jgi:hypothetical protein